MADEHAVTVRDDPVSSSYELLLDGERVGRLHYLPTPGVVVLVHTEIAPELEGKGLGGRLVAGAFGDIRARGLSLVPICPFVTSYLERHPEHADLVARKKAAAD